VTADGLAEAAAAAAQAVSPEVLLQLAVDLDEGRLTARPTAGALQSRLAMPSARLGPIRRLLDSTSDVNLLVTAIRVAVITAERVRGDAAKVEIAATRLQQGVRVRTTGGVARDIVAGATERLLLVGYSVTADPSLAGLAAKTLRAMGEAATRGVAVTAIIHRDEPNRAAILRAWPPNAPHPHFYTWPEQASEPMAKMHAKVIVADARDALVTSANLTRHGFVGNVEMGVRIIGKPAKTVADVFERLLVNGAFVSWAP
jgi:phosphatidylserine/phosphatidylglycerophosphate/cardiolipin synthase-like enzyme